MALSAGMQSSIVHTLEGVVSRGVISEVDCIKPITVIRTVLYPNYQAKECALAVSVTHLINLLISTSTSNNSISTTVLYL